MNFIILNGMIRCYDDTGAAQETDQASGQADAADGQDEKKKDQGFIG